LIDVAASLQGVSTSEVEALATVWGIDRLWRTTVAAIDALLIAARPPWSLRLWARHLGSVRERTVFETHLSRWFAGFSIHAPTVAIGVALRAAVEDLRPVADEDWPTKLGRTRRAVRDAFIRRSRHDAEVERASDLSAGGSL
jgi:hypothetical protein